MVFETLIARTGREKCVVRAYELSDLIANSPIDARKNNCEADGFSAPTVIEVAVPLAEGSLNVTDSPDTGTPLVQLPAVNHEPSFAAPVHAVCACAAGAAPSAIAAAERAL